jgi:DNA-binding winged helix-turn-helix (wHTH) protein
MQAKFGAFIFDDATHELRCGNQPVHLSPKAFDLLAVLIRHRPNAVAKPDLHREVWPDTFVSDGSLAVLITEIRRALGDSANGPSFVRTVNRFGYAFVAPTDDSADGSSHSRSAAVAWLLWGSERARLKAGENVVGRDPDADVCIDAVGVSRRHAVIVVNDAAVIRDLSSKNGTFVNGMRITAPVRLSDNTEIRVGPIDIRFRRASLGAPTQTLRQSQHSRG